MLTNIGKKFFFTTLFLFLTAWAEDSDVELLPLKAFGSIEIGALENYTIDGKQFKDFEWLQRSSVYLLQQANVGESWQTFLGVGVSNFTVIERDDVPMAQARRGGAGITQATARYTLGGYEKKDYLFGGELGIFGYKYNRHSKNLGEYMFRSYAFPPIVNTGGLDVVGTSAAYLTGLRLDGNLPGGLHWNLFWTFEMDHPPLKAQSITAIVDYEIADGLIELGAGFQAQNIIYNSINDVQPKDPATLVYTTTEIATGEERSFSKTELDAGAYCFNCEPDTSSADLNIAFAKTIEKDDSANTVGYDVDVTDGVDYNPIWNITDSTYMSFAGNKVMVRGAVNFQKLLQLDILGPEDLTIYAEAIMLGTKPIPFWAETWQERTPMMFGINLPAFKILDVLAFELEYYQHKYPLSLNNVFEDVLPSMSLINPNDVWQTYDVDDWKFTVYARRTLAHGIAIHAQVARDHFKALDLFNKPETMELTERDGDEGIFDLGDFYWMLKFQYMF